MLRRFGESPAESPGAPSKEAAFPGLDQPFGLEERASGVRFYKGRESFFHPYALLQRMSFEAEVLTVVFLSAEITLTGRGLHTLYIHLAEHRVAWIAEQGQRFSAASDAAVHITKIQEIEKQTSAPGE